MPEPKPIDLSKIKNLDKFKHKFWKRVDQPFVGCWEWQGVRSTQGYGSIRFGKKPYPAHRVAWELLYGEIPEGMLVLHKCDNKCCVRPGHLYIGTQKDNVRDIFDRNRMPGKHKRRPKPGHLHKLSVEQVKEIRIRYANKESSTRKLAKEYGVAQVTIWDIISRNSWRNL